MTRNRGHYPAVKFGHGLAVAMLLAAASAQADEPVEASRGWYGGMAMGPSLEPFGAGSELDRGCTDLGAASCSTPMPLGGMLLVHVGMMEMPWGVELMVQGGVDYAHPTATFDGVPHKPYGNPLLSSPAREEKFIILRGGATAGVRVRRWIDGPSVRWSFAGGLGVSYKYMALEREVTTTGGLEDRPYFSHGTPYVSPALSLDAAAHARATATLAVSFGLSVLGETAWSNTRSVADPTRMLVGNSDVAPVATPAYRMASSVQVLVVPYIGLAFGK
jgi:hypothetical protein